MDIEVLRWKELCAVAGTPAKARTLIKDGVYRRVLHDAYVLADVPDDVTTRCAALRLVLPPDVVLCGWSALWVCGLDVLPRDRDKVDLLDVVVPRSRHLERRPGMRPHSALVPDEEICELNGLVIVTGSRAFVDVVRYEGLVEGVACGDAALRAGLTTLDRVEESVDRAGGLRWVTRAREAIPHLEPRSESLMESRLRVGFVLEGGPRLAAQVDLYDENDVHYGRADLFKDGVAVEYDGRAERLEKAKFVTDRTRGNNISDLEVEVRRFTSEDMFKRTPRERLAVLRRALEIAARRSRPRLRFGRDTLRSPRMRPLPTKADGRNQAA
jgi:hypothetical protein